MTFVDHVRPDGAVARWGSRRQRKHLGGPAAGSTWWAPRARGWWIAVLFAVGSLVFALGAVPAYASAVGTRWDALTFFIGSLFCSNLGTLVGAVCFFAGADAAARAHRGLPPGLTDLAGTWWPPRWRWARMGAWE